MLNEPYLDERGHEAFLRYRGMNPEFYRNAVRKANERVAREKREQREKAAAEKARRIEAIEAQKAARAAELERINEEIRRTEEERVAALEAKEAEAMKEEEDAHRPFVTTVERVVRLACRVFKVSRVDLISSRRDRHLVFARQFVMYWARRRTVHSLPMIGRRLGNRDHTTVIHGSRLYSMKRAEMGRRLRSFGAPKRQFKLSGASR